MAVLTRRAALVSALAVASCTLPAVNQTANPAKLPVPLGVAIYDFSLPPQTGARLHPTSRTQIALAQQLTARLAFYGLPIMRIPPGVAPPPRTLLVQGRILPDDPDDRAGSGRLAAEAQLYYASGSSRPEPLQAFTADSTAANRLADMLASQIGKFAEAQGWIPPGSVR